MKMSEIHMKIIAIGLFPVFLIIAFVMPENPAKTLLMGGIILTAFVISFLGMSMQKKDEEQHDDDLLAVPPKKI